MLRHESLDAIRGLLGRVLLDRDPNDELIEVQSGEQVRRVMLLRRRFLFFHSLSLEAVCHLDQARRVAQLVHVEGQAGPVWAQLRCVGLEHSIHFPLERVSLDVVEAQLRKRVPLVNEVDVFDEGGHALPVELRVALRPRLHVSEHRVKNG